MCPRRSHGVFVPLTGATALTLHRTDTNEVYALADDGERWTPGVTSEQDLSQGELTANATAEGETGHMFDACDGREDLDEGLPRHASASAQERSHAPVAHRLLRSPGGLCSGRRWRQPGPGQRGRSRQTIFRLRTGRRRILPTSAGAKASGHLAGLSEDQSSEAIERLLRIRRFLAPEVPETAVERLQGGVLRRASGGVTLA